MKSKLLRTAIHTLVAGACLTIGAGAFAQSSNQPNNNTKAKKLANIQVTGTRIRRASYATASPVVTISRQQILNTGQPTLAAALQQLPAANAPGFSSSSGFAIETVSLRGLGAKRTLLLLNGKRFITDPNGIPDIGAIPTEIVDHVEFLKAGASAVYGSDALAGVINVITLKHYNGAEAKAYYGSHFGDGHWDGKNQRYSVTIGSSGDRYSSVFNVSYATEGPIRATHRDLTFYQGGYGVRNFFGGSVVPGGRFKFAVPPSAVLNPGTSGAIPNPAITGLTSSQCPTGAGSKNSPFSGTLLPRCDLTINAGQPGTSAGDFRPFKHRTNGVIPGPGDIDRANYNNYNSLIVPHDSKSVYAQGQFDITPHFNIHATAYYDNEDTEFLGAPPNVTINANNVPADISASNPYNPFGFALDATGGDNNNVDSIQRKLISEGRSVSDNLLVTMDFSGGFGGDFNIGDRTFNWTADYTYNHLDQIGGAHARDSDFSLYEQPFLQQLNGDLSDCQGTPGTNSCVPFNLFGAPGAITQDMLYWARNGGATSRPQTQQVATLNISGSDLVDLPAGPLGASLGYEYQERDGHFYDNFGKFFLPNGNHGNDFGGRYHKNAVYGELQIPVLADLPLVQTLDLHYAVRYSDYDTFGSAVTNNGGIRWKPTNDLLIRGTIAQGFRAPKINDLYSGQYSTNGHVSDICDSRNTDRPQSCLSGVDGLAPVPADYLDTSTTTTTTLGSNPGLQPEESLSKTLGFVYSPSAVPGLSLTADYWYVSLSNLILGTPGVGTLLDQCYFVNNLDFCSHLTRASDGRLTAVNRSRTNRRSERTDGIDASVSYKLPSFSFGDFSVDLSYDHIRQFIVTGPVVANTDGSHLTENVGNRFHPRNSANFGLDWNLGNWSAHYNIYYRSSSYTDCSKYIGAEFPQICTNPNKEFVDPSGRRISIYKTPAIVYNDVNASYNFSSINTRFTLGLNNIFGYEGAKLGRTGFYRVPGRFVWARLEARF